MPGPYTLLLKLKNKKAVAKNVHNYDLKGDVVLGVRMPNHWFLAVAYSSKTPLVTTSANITGQDFMTSLEDLDITIMNNVDYIFYDGPKHGALSTIIHLEGQQIRRQTGEGFFTTGTNKSLNLTPLFNSIRYGLTWTAAMPLDFTPAVLTVDYFFLCSLGRVW